MKQSHWSPADLNRQRLVVRRIALRTEADLPALAAARSRLVADVRGTLGGPLALLGCFGAGYWINRRSPSHAPANPEARQRGGLVRLVLLLRTLALSAPAFSAFFRSVATSPQKSEVSI
jgi:hypothetical protein